MSGLRFKALLLDLDGTLYFKGEMLPRADEAVAGFRRKGLRLRFLTNTDSKTPATIRSELKRMGLEAAEAEIFTPATAAFEFFRRNPGKRCHCLLSRELAQAFAPYISREGKADYVVVGDFRESVTYEALNAAFRHIMAGAEIIALQKGRYFVRPEGLNLDTGAFVAMFEYASGKQAQVLGKPSPEFFHLCLSDLGLGPGDVAVVGDDVTTDVVGARNVGAFSVLVKTGKYSDAARRASAAQPDLVVESAYHLLDHLGEVGG
ncbi:MAG: TIGR01458 family HAD-type hydrolase [Acetobacteraceae bacterium]|nr:TIGR01458 family HAD-type hydrolase [Acetobacteraceae bacterium]